MDMTFDCTTDTATLVVFDEAALKHRMGERADWWSVPREELLEVNRGNAIFAGLGGDGTYTVNVHDGPLKSRSGSFFVSIRCLSGRLFTGPGEEMVGGGLGPTTETGGVFVRLDSGAYRVHMTRTGAWHIEISIVRTYGDATNAFNHPLTLDQRA